MVQTNMPCLLLTGCLDFLEQTTKTAVVGAVETVENHSNQALPALF